MSESRMPTGKVLPLLLNVWLVVTWNASPNAKEIVTHDSALTFDEQVCVVPFVTEELALRAARALFAAIVLHDHVPCDGEEPMQAGDKAHETLTQYVWTQFGDEYVPGHGGEWMHPNKDIGIAVQRAQVRDSVGHIESGVATFASPTTITE
jgi:hypothetical protein